MDCADHHEIVQHKPSFFYFSFGGLLEALILYKNWWAILSYWRYLYDTLYSLIVFRFVIVNFLFSLRYSQKFPKTITLWTFWKKVRIHRIAFLFCRRAQIIQFALWSVDLLLEWDRRGAVITALCLRSRCTLTYLKPGNLSTFSPR